MHDPSDNPRPRSNPDPPQSLRTELRRHYFHFATGHNESVPAILLIADQALDVTIPEQTQYGFTAIGTARVADGLRLGVPWVLAIEEKRFEVFPQWIHCAADGRVQIGLRRMQQLSSAGETGLIQRFRSHFKAGGQWALVLAIVVMVLSATWLMRHIYYPTDSNTRGQAVRWDNLRMPLD